MSINTSELNRRLREAGTAGEVLAALTAVVYRRAHPGADCPGRLVPDVWQLQEPVTAPASEESRYRVMGEYNARMAECVAAIGERHNAIWNEGVKAVRDEYGDLPNGRDIQDEPGGSYDERFDAVQARVAPEAREAWAALYTVLLPHRTWQAAIEAKPDAKLGHPLAPAMSAWLAAQRETVEPFRPRVRASLPRFDRTTVDEARLLAYQQSALDVGPGQIALLHADDVVDSCPAWLLGMFRRAVSVRTGQGLGSTRGGMPWSFTLTIGGLAHYDIRDRLRWAPFGRDLLFGVDETIGWLHPGGWKNRRRDWATLDAAFEETPSYRVTVDGERFSVVSAYGLPAVYSPEARVTLNVRVPPSAAHGARFDWNRYHVAYAKRAAHQRALLATAGLLDRTAHRGNPLTRLVREPVLDADGEPRREIVKGRDGKPRRKPNGQYETRPVFSGNLVPNPLLGSVQPAILPDKHLALFLGMADSGKNRHDAKAALLDLERDGVIDLERVPNGFRVFGPAPKAGRVIG